MREGRLFIRVVFSGLCLAAKSCPQCLKTWRNKKPRIAPGFFFGAAKVLTRRVRGHTHQGKPRNSQNHSLYTSAIDPLPTCVIISALAPKP